MKKIVCALMAALMLCASALAEPRIMIDGAAPDLAAMEPGAAAKLIAENSYRAGLSFTNNWSGFDAESGIAFFYIDAQDYVNLRQLGRESAWFALDVFGSVFDIPGCKSATISISAPMTGGRRGMICSMTMNAETAAHYDFDLWAEYVYTDTRTVYATFDNYFVDSSVQKEFFKH